MRSSLSSCTLRSSHPTQLVPLSEVFTQLLRLSDPLTRLSLSHSVRSSLSSCSSQILLPDSACPTQWGLHSAPVALRSSYPTQLVPLSEVFTQLLWLSDPLTRLSLSHSAWSSLSSCNSRMLFKVSMLSSSRNVVSFISMLTNFTNVWPPLPNHNGQACTSNGRVLSTSRPSVFSTRTILLVEAISYRAREMGTSCNDIKGYILLCSAVLHNYIWYLLLCTLYGNKVIIIISGWILHPCTLLEAESSVPAPY